MRSIKQVHDCKATNTSLLDLIFEETSVHEKTRLVAEIESCAVCKAEYSSLRETLRAVEQSAKSALPSESFRQAYHARLTRQIKSANARQTNWSAAHNENPLKLALGNLFNSRLPVPLPIAAVFVLLFVAAAFVALRTTRQSIVTAPPSAPPVETRTVEVPVIQEKVIRQVVYVEKNRARVRRGDGAGEQLRSSSNAVAKLQKETFEQTRASLQGFKPADEVKLKIIKGSSRDDK